MNERLEQPIYQNLNVTIRKLNSDSLENQDIKDFFNDTISYDDEVKDIKIITKIDPIVQEDKQQKKEEEIKKISFSNLDTFKEYDPEIIEDIDAKITDCDPDLLEEALKLFDLEKLKKIISVLIIRFDTNPRNYTKDDYESLIKVIIQLFGRQIQQEQNIDNLIKDLNLSNDKIGILESIIYANNIQIPLYMNIVMEDKIYNILDDHNVNIKPTVIYKGEDVSAECLFYIDDVEYKSNDINIDISFNYNRIISKTIVAKYKDMQTSRSLLFNAEYPYYYGETDKSNIQLYNEGVTIDKFVTHKITIEDENTTFVFAYPKSRGLLKKILDNNALDCILDFAYTEQEYNNTTYLVYYRTASDPLDQNFTFIWQ